MAQNRILRLLKAAALKQVEKVDEATKLLRELSKEDFAPAIYRLATHLDSSEDENERKEAITLFEQYVRLEPYDPRALHDLADAYDNASDYVKAEAANRKLVDLKPSEATGYVDLVTFLVVRDRLYSDNGQYALAHKFLQAAIQLDEEWDEPYISLALLYRRQSRFALALKAANKAIELDEKDGEAQYERACALARLGRIREAISSLEKAIELDPDTPDWLADEKDLKALSRLPAFKKLLPPPEKQ